MGNIKEGAALFSCPNLDSQQSGVSCGELASVSPDISSSCVSGGGVIQDVFHISTELSNLGVEGATNHGDRAEYMAFGRHPKAVLNLFIFSL